jgi:universal stress protein E
VKKERRRKGMSDTQLSPTGRLDKILLATDGSEYSTGAVRAATELARKCGGRVYAMTMALSNPEYDTLAPHLAEQAEQEAQALLEEIQAAARAAGVDCETLLRRGDEPSAEIVSAAEDLQADVIVMGRRGKRGLARLMVGHATAKVVGQARCAVLVVPRAAKLPERRILLATDGSRYADAAASTAGNLAARCNLPLTVLSVTTPSHSRARREEASAAVERVVAFLRREGLAAEGMLTEGRPDTAIIETAEAQEADLIVVGSHGRSGLERVLVGSVSERVIGGANCAVLAVKT